MVEVLATLLMDHSLELVVDEQTLKDCNSHGNIAWGKRRDQAIRKLKDDIEANINIVMLKELPIRVVKRAG